MMMQKLIALLVCILLLATAQAEAPANTSAAETTEYGWTLKIGRTAAKGMPIQDLLNTLAAQDCPAVFAVGGWTGFMGAAPSEYAGYVMLLFPGEVRIMLNIKPDDDDENAEAEWNALMESHAAAALTAENIAAAVPNWKIDDVMLSSNNGTDGFFYVDLEDYVSPEDAFDSFEFNIIKLQ